MNKNGVCFECKKIPLGMYVKTFGKQIDWDGYPHRNHRGKKHHTSNWAKKKQDLIRYKTRKLELKIKDYKELL